jgi:hypothetical protein
LPHSPLEKLMILEKNVFEYVYSSLGGTFYTIETNAAIWNNTFNSNMANEMGGALYLSCDRSKGKNCILDV